MKPVNKIGLGASYSLDLSSQGSLWAPESNTLFARMTTPPTETRKGLIDAVIVSLKTNGIWTKLDALYMFAAADAQASLLNWKSTSFNATNVSATAFATDVGYTGDGASDYIDSNFNILTGGNYTQDSACFFGWSNTTGQEAKTFMGTTVGVGFNRIYPRWTTDFAFYLINASTGELSVANANGSGLWSVNRSTSTAVQLYRNGSSLHSGSQTSAVPGSDDMRFLAGVDFSAKQCLCGGIGGSLTATEQTNLYNALHIYLQTVAGIA
jgi:hypothetical protein